MASPQFIGKQTSRPLGYRPIFIIPTTMSERIVLASMMVIRAARDSQIVSGDRQCDSSDNNSESKADISKFEILIVS